MVVELGISYRRAAGKVCQRGKGAWGIRWLEAFGILSDIVRMAWNGKPAKVTKFQVGRGRIGLVIAMRDGDVWYQDPGLRWPLHSTRTSLDVEVVRSYCMSFLGAFVVGLIVSKV